MSEYKKTNIPIQHIAGFGLMVIVLSIIAWMIAPIGEVQKQPVKTPSVIEAPSNVVITNENKVPYLTDEQITKTRDALARALPIDQSCYDKDTNFWIIHSVKPKDDDDWPEGWYYELDDLIEVEILGNGTWALTDTNSLFNTPIYPDITGLNCKSHIPHK